MLTVDEARVLITTSISDVDLLDIIAREEAWLARRIGPLDGERIESFVIDDGDEVLELQRPGIISLVEDASGAIIDYEYRGWSDIILTAGTWDTLAEVTYVPNDDDEVKRALVTLTRLVVAETAFQSESSQSHAAVVSHADQRQMRWAAWRSLLRPMRPTTVRLRSAIPAGGTTIRSVAVTSTGS